MFIGYEDLGATLMDKFKWGHTFFEVNGELLDTYAACKNSSEVVAAQQEHLDKLEEEINHKKTLGTILITAIAY